jgi:ATP diphosphatase
MSPSAKAETSRGVQLVQPGRDLSRLIEIMAALREPETGCPWDIEQDFKSISHYTVEEAYEVADAIEREDYVDLCEELGDLILQPVYHAQMAAEAGYFDIGDVIEAITKKLIRRHPHVFETGDADNANAVKKRWDEIKAEERAEKAAKKGEVTDKPLSILDNIPLPLPALSRAEKLDRRAASVGFDWPDAQSVLAKCREELDEIEKAISAGNKSDIQEEIGDALFALSSLSRHLGIEPEAALKDANAKFTRRFHYVEDRCRQTGLAPEKAGMKQLDAFWNEIRQAEKQAKTAG